MRTPRRVLFICKKRRVYGSECSSGFSSGLFNSARFVCDMLENELEIHSKIVDVRDNNDIDREVTKFKPTHVIIEALWVVPEKFHILRKLHPSVKWIVRLHSEIPFLALEGSAMSWIYGYDAKPNVFVAMNSERLQDALQGQLYESLYLPNYYPVNFDNHEKSPHLHNHIDIGCFGAIRPLKNQLSQAIAAIRFADDLGKSLHFHINSERAEGWSSDSILKNLRVLFSNNPRHRLVEYPWMSHDAFLHVVRKMHLGMQVSFTESFNIVTADMVDNNIPVVVSDEVRWVSILFKADPTSIDDIVRKLRVALLLSNLGLQELNKLLIYRFSKKSKYIWKRYLES